MENVKKLVMLFLVGVALVGCSSLQTVSDYDKNANFAGYRTYGFYDKGLEKLRLNNLDKRRLMAAVELEMSAKGFTKADKPDILVNLVVVAKERADYYDSGFYGGWGWGRGWGWGGAWGGGRGFVDHYTEGTIIIDFLDPAKKILVWHGRGIGFNLDSFNKREERLQLGVNEILAQYPPNAKTE